MNLADPVPSDAMPVRRVLVLGGARSGKSRYAQHLAQTCGHEAIFIATAEAYDDEMRERIARHRAERDERWRTLEAPIDLPEKVAGVVGEGRIILVDCLTLWLSNLMLGNRDVAAATASLCGQIAALPGRAIFVSNEVGHGIVPDNALARRFRDEQGRLNQMMAEVCDAVVLVTAGLPLQIKPALLPKLTGWDGSNATPGKTQSLH